MGIFEITTYRTERGYSDKRHPDEVKWGKSLQEDVERRDFTINAMAMGLNPPALRAPSPNPKDLGITQQPDPGSQHDGVTIEIPVAVLNQLPPAAFTWHVPGYREDLATELIRSLPKSLRTSFVPAPNHAAAALAWLAQRPDVASAPEGDTAPDTIAFPDALGPGPFGPGLHDGIVG